MILADSTGAIQLSPDGPKAYSEVSGWIAFSGRENPRQAELDKLGLNRPRIEEYLRLLRGMKVSRVSRVDQGWARPVNDVAFDVYSYGNVADSYTKKIVHFKGRPSPLRPDTDTPEFKRDNSVVYADLGDGWYIEKTRD